MSLKAYVFRSTLPTHPMLLIARDSFHAWTIAASKLQQIGLDMRSARDARMDEVPLDRLGAYLIDPACVTYESRREQQTTEIKTNVPPYYEADDFDVAPWETTR